MWHGGKILVVEDSYLLAEEVCTLVRNYGLEPIGPVGRLEQACQVARERALDGVVLDMRLHQNFCFPICVILKARKIPFVLMTGYIGSSLIPLELRSAPVLGKPFDEDELRAALASILNCTATSLLETSQTHHASTAGKKLIRY
jgi:DNA-binding response OmpR family regulator